VISVHILSSVHRCEVYTVYCICYILGKKLHKKTFTKYDIETFKYFIVVKKK